LLTKFPGLATSGRHNSAMITNRMKLTTKIALYRMSIVSILPLESIQSLSPCPHAGLYAPYKERTSHILATTDVRLGKPSTPLQLPGCRHERKADWKNWNSK